MGRRLTIALSLLCSGTVHASVPLPTRLILCFPNEPICPSACIFHVAPPQNACQYRFLANGSADRLVLTLTLQDEFAVPVPACSTSVTLSPASGTPAFCACEPVRKTAFTDAGGAAQFAFSHIGGRGDLLLAVTTHSFGDIWVYDATVTFTSPDLDGSCESSGATNVFDLGIWAGGLPPGFATASDCNCDGTVNVFDLGLWAQGLGVTCGGP